MPPRKSKAARRSLAHSDVTSESPQTNGSALGERARTNWSTVDSSSFPGFTIKYLEHYKQDVKDQKRKAILKRKLQAEIDQPDDKSVAVQDNPFEGTSLPDLYYAVEPPEYWEDTSRYRKFTSMCSHETCFCWSQLTPNLFIQLGPRLSPSMIMSTSKQAKTRIPIPTRRLKAG